MERQAPRATPSFLFSFLSTPRKEKKSGIALAYGAANTNQRKLFFFDCLRSAGRTALFNQSHQWKQRHLLYWMVDWKRMLPLAITALVSFTIDSFHFSIVHQRLVNGATKANPTKRSSFHVCLNFPLAAYTVIIFFWFIHKLINQKKWNQLTLLIDGMEFDGWVCCFLHKNQRFLITEWLVMNFGLSSTTFHLINSPFNSFSF